MSKRTDTVGALALFLTGAAAGVVIGMLYAPDKGKVTRRRIRDKARDLKDRAGDCCENVSEKMKGAYREVVSSDKAREAVGKAILKVRSGLEKCKENLVEKTIETAKDIETELDRMK